MTLVSKELNATLFQALFYGFRGRLSRANGLASISAGIIKLYSCIPDKEILGFCLR